MMVKMPTLEEKLRAEELKAKAFADLMAALKDFPDNATDDERRSFCLFKLLNWTSDMTDCEIAQFKPLIKKKLKVNWTEFKNDLWKVRKEKRHRTNSKPQDQPSHTMTQREANEALLLLQRSDLLDKVLEVTEQLGCVGEDDPKILTFLTMTSRKLQKPFNETVKAESAAGKNHLVNTIAKLMPDEDIIQLTAMTPKSLYHRKDSLAHKAVIVCERWGAEEADYSLRVIQSEGKLKFSYTARDPETGQFETIDKELEGPISYIETTTKAHGNDENETRYFDVYLDESTDQTSRIFKAQARRYSGEHIDEQAITKPWKNAQRLLKPIPVYIPYVDLITFPAEPLRVRRDHERFLGLIETLALLFQHQRKQKQINGQTFIEASADDYEIARDLLINILGKLLSGCTPKCEQLVVTASTFIDQTTNLPEEFKIAKLEAHLGWSRPTTAKFLHEAVSIGCIDLVSAKKGTAFTYQWVKNPKSFTDCLLTRDELEARMPKAEAAVNL